MNNVPEDIAGWLNELSLFRRLETLQKNLLLGFIDGTLVAEVIASTYPRLVEVHNYKETSSAAVRLQNWTMLNKKVLATIKCELGEQDISKIASRNIQRSAVITFLRLLRTKLKDYEPTYASESSTIAQQQKRAIHKLTKASGSGTNSPRRVSASAFGVRSMQSSGIDDLVTEAGTRPALAKSMKILKSKEDVKGVKKRAEKMSEEDVDAMYEEFAGKMSDKLSHETLEANEMLHKSLAIEHHLLALKEQNLVDLQNVDQNLRTLHYELNHLHEATGTKKDQIAAEDLERGLEAERKAKGLRNKNISTKPTQQAGRRSSMAITDAIFRMIPEEKKGGVVDSKLEKEISRRQSKCLEKMGLRIPGATASYNPDSPTSKKSVRINTKHNETSSSANLFDDSGDVREDVADAVALELEDLRVEATHRRVFDSNTDRHFYVEIATSTSSWTSPTEGIIKCIDDRTGKPFYTNAETKQTAWSLEEVQ